MHLNDLKREVKLLIKEHGIKVTRAKFKSPAGRAWVQDRIIKIPKMDSFQAVGTTIHEVAHIILNHPDDYEDYLREYETERWTIKYLKKHDMHKDYKVEFNQLVENSKLYVQSHLERYITRSKKKGIEPKIKKSVLKWLNCEIYNQKKDY
jgi:hypothetical protein